ncbi:MAG: hypothetical protein FJZ04_02645 [Candidatus Moranbacteria bacterium]|nr:hypothetical protein [Candidatus Moranbacteria bacterium]
MRKLTRETNGGKTFVASSSSVSWTKIFPNLRNIGTSPPWSYRLPSSSSPGGIYTPPAPGGFSSSPGGIYTPRAPGGFSSSPGGIYTPRAPGGFSSSPGGIYIPTPAQNLSLFGRLAPYAAAIAPYAAAIAPYAAGTGAMVATGLALEQLFPSEEMGPLGTGKKELYDPNNFGPSGDPGFPSEAIRAHNDWVGKRQEPGAMPPVKPGQPGQGQDVGTGQVGQPASGPTYWDTMPNADGSASLITIDFFGNQVVDGVIVKTKEKLEEEKQAMGERAKSEQKDPNNPDDTTQQGNVQDKPSKTEGQTP